MPKNKKKLKGVTFQLVHRSQQDPLVADETASQRVLVPLNKKESKAEREKRVEEQHKYGVYFDDDSNYLQHLKDSKDNRVEWPEFVENELQKMEEKRKKRQINLPSSVFPSEVEEDVGMLSKAAPVSGPQLHLDPDLVAAMDDDFDYDDPENQLEDNFMELAEGVTPNDDLNEYNDDNYVDSDSIDEDLDEVGSLDNSDKSLAKEETKSRFTNYSKTSSVIRRNDQLKLLDARFEKMFAQYDDSQIGALDTEEIEGHILESSDIFQKCVDEFSKQQQRQYLDKEEISEQVRARILKYGNEESEEEEFRYVEVKEKPKWDCQTILSTRSNKYNHPKLIMDPPSKKKIKINKRTGIPKNVLESDKLTSKALDEFNEQNAPTENEVPQSHAGQSVISQLSTLSIRPKDETPEERRERKKALKEYRKERRIEKKLNAQAFKEEAKRQTKISKNNRNNVQGNKIL